MTVPRHVHDVTDAEFLGAMRHVGGSFEQESMVAVGSVRVALIDALVDHQWKAEAFRDGAGNVKVGFSSKRNAARIQWTTRPAEAAAGPGCLMQRSSR